MNPGFYNTISTRFADWNYSHPYFLYAFIRAMKPAVVVECGLYRAFAACWMARALQENNTGKLVAIDNFSLKEHVERYGDPRKHAEDNLRACGVDGWVEIREGETNDENLWPESADVVYLDAWHSHDAAWFELDKAVQIGAKVIALDDTENCVGPRLLVDKTVNNYAPMESYQRLDLHSDNGLTIFVKKQPRRLITFSQELPYPNPGVDLRPLTPEQQAEHFKEASAITGLDYSSILNQTEHDQDV